MKGGAQHNLLERKSLPGRSWPHHPVSDSLGSWEALGGLRGQSTLNLESGVGVLKEQVSQPPSLRFSIAQAAEAGLKHLLPLLPLSQCAMTGAWFDFCF